MLDAIPTERPITPLLDSIDETEKLRELDVDQLERAVVALGGVAARGARVAVQPELAEVVDADLGKS